MRVTDVSKEIIEDLTSVVERLELLEEKFSIEVSGLYADLHVFDGVYFWTQVSFDVVSKTGGTIENDLRFVINYYNSNGQLIQSDDRLILAHRFLGIASIQDSFKLASIEQKPHKIRIYPVID